MSSGLVVTIRHEISVVRGPGVLSLKSIPLFNGQRTAFGG
jgi:hypothetical protein